MRAYKKCMAQHADVLVLGGGVIGLTSAYYLSRAGVRLGVLDRGDLGQESSWAGAGILSPAPTMERARTPIDHLAALSARLFPTLSQDLRASTGIDNGHVVRGGVVLLDAADVQTARNWREEGIEFETADRLRLKSVEPAVEAGEQSAYLLPATGQVRNPRHLKALLGWCGLKGVALHRGCPVLGFQREGRRVVAVRTAEGPVHADQFLVTAGAWSDTLTEGLGWRPGIRPVRGQIAL